MTPKQEKTEIAKLFKDIQKLVDTTYPKLVVSFGGVRTLVVRAK